MTSKSIFITAPLILSIPIFLGSACLSPVETVVLPRVSLTVPQNGVMTADEHEVKVYDSQAVLQDSRIFSAQIKGVLTQPISRQPVVFFQEDDTWTMWLLGTEQDQLVYSSKIPFQQCELTRNGYWAWCLQAGDLNLIRLKDGLVQRVDGGVMGAAWSPNSTDLLIQYADRMEQVSLDVTDQLGPHTLISGVSGDWPLFLKAGEVLWWTGDDTQRTLLQWSLQQQTSIPLWTGVADAHTWVNASGTQVAFGSTTLLDPTTQQVLGAMPGYVPVGWVDSQLLLKQPVEQANSLLYHFSTAEARDFGTGLFATTDSTLKIDFQ